MSDFIIEGKDGGFVPPFFVFAADGGSMVGPFDTYVAAKQWVREQLMGNEDNIASISKTVATTAANVALLTTLTTRLKESSELRDRLMGLEQNDIAYVNIQFVTHSKGTTAIALDASSMAIILKLIATSTEIATERVQNTLKMITETAGLIHTP